MQKSQHRGAKEVSAESSTKKVKQEYKRIQRIRGRASYLLFQKLCDFLKTNPSMENILRKFYETLDARGGFGSRRNAEYAAESLVLVLEDNGWAR
jgi:hypothetical protein